MLSKFCVSYCVWSRSIGHCTHVYTVDMLCRLHRSCVHQCTCMSQRICKCKTMRSSTQVLRGVWLSIGLCEETGFQPSSELSTTNAWWAELWWKRVPDGWCCSTETPSAELCSCRRDKHVVAFCRYASPHLKVQLFSIHMCEEMGFQPSSKLSTTNGWWAELWWKRVPDGWGWTWKLRRPSCVLVEGTSMSCRSADMHHLILRFSFSPSTSLSRFG